MTDVLIPGKQWFFLGETKKEFGEIMAKYAIRFFVNGEAVTDVIEAGDLADAVHQAHLKLTSPSFRTEDEQGNPGMTLSQGQVEHLTVIGLPKLKKIETPVLRVVRDTPRRKPRPSF